MIRGAPKRILAMLAALTAASGLVACGGLGWAGGSGNAVNVLMVNNPQMVDLQKLTADNFTKQTGIKVNYTVLPENDLRDKISPGVLQPGRPVRRGHAVELRDPDLRRRTAGSPRWTTTSPRTRPSTRPTSSSR